MKGDTMAANPATLPESGKIETGKIAKRSAYVEETVRATRELNTPKPRPVGRPSEYTETRAETICTELAKGRSLSSICNDEGMPEMCTVYTWLRKFPEFQNRYSRARQDAADTLADEILRISDELEHATDPIQIQAARLRVESRRWIASRLKPQTWGDKVTTEITGADGAPLPLVTVQFVQPGAKQVEGEVIEADTVSK